MTKKDSDALTPPEPKKQKRSSWSRKEKRRLAIAAVVLFAAGTLYVLFLPKLTDPLCGYVRSLYMECLVLPADDQTYRPGAIARLVKDADEPEKYRVDLPNSYLDNGTCIIPGASITAWAPNPKPFQLQGLKYTRSALARVNGQLSQGMNVNVGPKSSRIQSVDLSFGPARTVLLDELSLINRVENCAILPSCVSQLSNQNYRVVNRVLVVDEMSYEFKDSRDAALSLADLRASDAVTVGGAFATADGSSGKLISKQPLAVAVQLISDTALRAARPCTASAVYAVEGRSQVTAGGGGRPGHIAENVAPISAELGKPAALELFGSEPQHGDLNRNQSWAKANALVEPIRNNEVRLAVMTDVHGGHYENRGFAGIGIASTHDTGANATAEATGRINVLLRKGAGLLKLGWSGLPSSGGSVTARNSIEVSRPDGTIQERIPIGEAQGRQSVWLKGEGQYAVIGHVLLRAETSGASGHAVRAADARITAEIDFDARTVTGERERTPGTRPPAGPIPVPPQPGNVPGKVDSGPNAAAKTSRTDCASIPYREMSLFVGCPWPPEPSKVQAPTKD